MYSFQIPWSSFNIFLLKKLNMFLIQILLPVYNNQQKPFPKEKYIQIQNELTEKFGGLTSFMRSPAVGLWKENEQNTVRDDIVIFEVMAEEIELEWWQKYREKLCKLFMQQELIMRASEIQLL